MSVVAVVFLTCSFLPSNILLWFWSYKTYNPSMTLHFNFFFPFAFPGHKVLHWTQMGEGNGTPLQYCCLENPMDGGAW